MNANKFTNNVVLVSSKGKDYNVMTCAWNMKTSNDPYLIAIALGKERETLKNIKKTKEFGLIFLNSEQNTISNISGSNSSKDFDKIKVLKELGAEFYKANKIDVLLTKDAAANIECKVVNVIETGDHFLVIGEVIDSSASDKDVLMYAAGKYWKVSDNVAKPSKKELDKIKKIIEKNKRN